MEIKQGVVQFIKYNELTEEEKVKAPGQYLTNGEIKKYHRFMRAASKELLSEQNPEFIMIADASSTERHFMKASQWPQAIKSPTKDSDEFVEYQLVNFGEHPASCAQVIIKREKVLVTKESIRQLAESIALNACRTFNAEFEDDNQVIDFVRQTLKERGL